MHMRTILNQRETRDTETDKEKEEENKIKDPEVKLNQYIS